MMINVVVVMMLEVENMVNLVKGIMRKTTIMVISLQCMKVMMMVIMIMMMIMMMIIDR